MSISRSSAKRLALTLFVALLGPSAGHALAGPLTPPSGAVTATGKTLTEVEPRTALSAANTPGDNDATPSVFRINQSGSYYLTGNVQLTPGRNAIEVAVSGVTIDLNGFTIFGLGGSAGISATSTTIERIAIRNGTMFGGGTAVSLASIRGVTVEDLKLEACINGGIVIGDASAVRRCTVINCGSGVVAGIGAEVSSVRVTDSDTGISCGQGSRVSACAVVSCGTVIDSRAISVSSGSIVDGCTAVNNTGKGIVTTNGCTVRDCSSYNNSAEGVLAGAGNTITACTVYSNTGDGIAAGEGCTITACSARFNGDDGIQTADDCTVTGCTTSNNTATGIEASRQCTITGCTSNGNTIDGISANSRCIIRGNNCSDNTGAGIRLIISGTPIPAATFCRVEDNICNSNDVGISLLSVGAGNMIVRNACGANGTNYSVTPTSGLGTIINTSSSAFQTANSNANYEY